MSRRGSRRVSPLPVRSLLATRCATRRPAPASLLLSRSSHTSSRTRSTACRSSRRFSRSGRRASPPLPSGWAQGDASRRAGCSGRPAQALRTTGAHRRGGEEGERGGGPRGAERRAPSNAAPQGGRDVCVRDSHTREGRRREVAVRRFAHPSSVAWLLVRRRELISSCMARRSWLVDWLVEAPSAQHSDLWISPSDSNPQVVDSCCGDDDFV